MDNRSEAVVVWSAVCCVWEVCFLTDLCVVASYLSVTSTSEVESLCGMVDSSFGEGSSAYRPVQWYV